MAEQEHHQQDFEVVGIEETPDYSNPNNTQTIVTVKYRTPSGDEGQIELPKHQAIPDHVAGLIAGEVANKEAIRRLRHGTAHKPFH